MWEDLKVANICVLFKNSVYMFCMGWGLEEVHFNMGMWEYLKGQYEKVIVDFGPSICEVLGMLIIKFYYN